jgi:thiosulfate/3-mercaptopyruvate sulfurtransferase
MSAKNARENELNDSFGELVLKLFRAVEELSALNNPIGNFFGSYNSRKTLICIVAGVFMLLSLAHVTQGSECGDLGKYVGVTCSTSTGWDAKAELDNMMGIGNATQASPQSPIEWPKVSSQYRWNQPVSGFNDSSSTKATTASPAETGTSVALQANQSASGSFGKPANYIEQKRSRNFYALAAPLSNISNFDVVLDVSDGVTKFIPGAVHVDYLDFQENGTLRPASDLARILGGAGISRNSSVLIYGECRPCGGGPAVSTYAYWVMRYLGHDPAKIRILDGGLENWVEANHSVINESLTRPKADYAFEQKPELLVTQEETKKGGFQLLDARSLREFGAESIPGSFNIPYDCVMINGRIKDEAALKILFSGIRKEKPVVVYTTSGVEASLVWFALEIMGYDAKLSTWQEMTKPKESIVSEKVSGEMK